MDIINDDLGGHKHYTADGEHKPAADHNNCTVKDPIISIFIPYYSE